MSTKDYDQGRDDGYKEGYREGYNKGYKEGACPITFKPNKEKAAEVLLWICAANGGSILDYNLYAVSYFAEIKHINKYGYPIIGDTYRAYENYIHADVLFDLTWSDKLVHNVQEKTDNYPSPRDGCGIIIGRRKPDTRLLSKSNLVCLHWAFTQCGQLRHFCLRNFLDNDKGWKTTGRGKIPWELLIEDESVKEDVREDSKDMVI